MGTVLPLSVVINIGRRLNGMYVVTPYVHILVAMATDGKSPGSKNDRPTAASPEYNVNDDTARGEQGNWAQVMV